MTRVETSAEQSAVAGTEGREITAIAALLLATGSFALVLLLI